MLTERELVKYHVLYEQNEIIERLIDAGAIPDESLYGEWWEVMEWWLVTRWLAERLKEQGEIVIEQYGCYWWGRQCSGQAVYMDGVITEIAESLA